MNITKKKVHKLHWLIAMKKLSERINLLLTLIAPFLNCASYNRSWLYSSKFLTRSKSHICSVCFLRKLTPSSHVGIVTILCWTNGLYIILLLHIKRRNEFLNKKLPTFSIKSYFYSKQIKYKIQFPKYRLRNKKFKLIYALKSKIKLWRKKKFN